MTCAEFQELAGAWAVGALDADERLSMEQHLQESQHQGCREAAARLESASHLLGLSVTPSRPPPHVWDHIAAATAAPRRSGGWMGWAVAGAIAAALMVVLLRNGDDRAQVERQLAAERQRCDSALQAQASNRELESRMMELMSSPTSRWISMKDQPGAAGTATAVFDAARHKAMVLSGSLPATPGKDYELWVIDGKSAIPAGLVHQLDNGVAIGEFDASRLGGNVDALAISEEPAGGSPQPTRVLMVGSAKG